MKVVLKSEEKVNLLDIDSGILFRIGLLISTGNIRVGKIYDAEEAPTKFDKDTFQPDPKRYVVKCDDGMNRMFPVDIFYLLEELREIKLNTILDA